MLGLCYCTGFSLLVENGGYFLLTMHGLLTAVASLVADHEHMSSVVVEHRLCSCGAQGYLPRGMWDLPGSGIEPMSPALQGRFLITRPPGKPKSMAFSLRTYTWS